MNFNRERMLNRLIEMIQIDSISFEEKAMSYNFFVRAISEQKIVVATATFKDSASPILGIVTGLSTNLISSSEMPFPSFPKTRRPSSLQSVS